MAAITCERFFFEKTSAIASGVYSTECISILKVQSLKIACFAVEILVMHVPAEGEPEFVNEVAARLLFLVGRGKVEFLVGPKIRHKLFTLCRVKAFSLTRQAASNPAGMISSVRRN